MLLWNRRSRILAQLTVLDILFSIVAWAFVGRFNTLLQNHPFWDTSLAVGLSLAEFGFAVFLILLVESLGIDKGVLARRARLTFALLSLFWLTGVAMTILASAEADHPFDRATIAILAGLPLLMIVAAWLGFRSPARR